MPYTITLRLRNINQGIHHLIYIYRRNLPPTCIPFIEILQLHRKDSGLNLIHTTISANIVEDIFAGAAVIAECLDGSSEGLVVGCDGTGITKGSEILRRIEAVSCSIAERASLLGLRAES